MSHEQEPVEAGCVFDLLYVPVTDHTPVVRLLRCADRAVISDAWKSFEANDVHGTAEGTYRVTIVTMDPSEDIPDGIPTGRPRCHVCASVRLTWTPGETFRCRSCGNEFTGELAGWQPS